MSLDVLSRLRLATRPAHERLEADLDILGHTDSAEGRRHLASRFHGLHAGAEAVLGPWLDRLPGLDFAGRRRRALLDRDLEALDEGAGVRATPAPCPLPAPRSAAEALGVLYVLEGSTLGGQVIRKRLLARGQAMTGLSFLDPYGPETGRRWKDFLAVLQRECPPDDVRSGEAAAKGAVTGFDRAGAWLCAPRSGAGTAPGAAS